MEISKEDFKAYENVRRSGITNMFDIGVVQRYSGLDREQILDIMKHYSQYAKKYIE